MKHAFTILLTILLVTTVFGASMEMTSARLYKKQLEFVKSLQFYNEELKKVPGDLEAHYERAELLGLIALDTTRKDLALQLAVNKDDPMKDLLERMVSGFQIASKPQTKDDESIVKKLKKKIDKILQEDWEYFYFLSVHEDSSYTKDKDAGVQNPDPKIHLQDALKHLGLAALLIPEKWNTYGLKAQVLNRLGDKDGSTAAWEQALSAINSSESAKKDQDIYNKAVGIIQENLLQNYYNTKQFAKTIAKAKEILEKEPKDDFAIQLKAYSLAEMTNDTSLTMDAKKALIADAIKALNEAKATSKDDAVVYYIGQFNLQLGDTAAAITSFTDYLKIDPKDATVLFNLGVLYLEGGSFVNTEKARDTFKQLTDDHDDNAAGWINYGVALLRLGDTVEGKKAIDKGKSLQSK